MSTHKCKVSLHKHSYIRLDFGQHPADIFLFFITPETSSLVNSFLSRNLGRKLTVHILLLRILDIWLFLIVGIIKQYEVM